MSNYRLGTPTAVDSLVQTGTSSFTNISVSGTATFNTHISIDGYNINLSSGAATNQVLQYDGSKFSAATLTGLAIGNVVSGGTTGSILFVGSSNFLQQDNANFFWDDTNNILNVHTLTIGTADGYSYIQLDDGYNDPVSAANTGRFKYNNTTKRFQSSVDGGAYSDFGKIAGEANSSDFQLTTTSATDVVSFTPSSSGNYVVYVFYRVATTTTNVTINVTWTDGAGTSTSVVVPTATSTVVGSYNTAPVYINATAAAIKVTATAGTANNLYVSASIVGIN